MRRGERSSDAGAHERVRLLRRGPGTAAPTSRQLAAGGRNDALDGLRALAVAAVMAFHLGVPGADAGFLGVDVFFVLSGFIITRLLLVQMEQGRLDVLGFWVRRVRRLAPALVVAVGAVIAWGSLGAAVIQRDALRSDITATLGYVANWHFIDTGTYFAATGEKSPLEHMWSLAVEEQFYVVWPATLLLLTVLVRPRGARLLAVGGAALAGVVFSAARLAEAWSAAAPDRAYMGTDTRLYGPLVGALVAVALARRPGLGTGRASNVLLLLTGTAAVAWGLGSLGSHTGASAAYAHGGALLVALGSASIVWALATRASLPSALLALAPLAYVGRISYGIYVWHWPLIVWSRPNQSFDLSGWPPVARGLLLAIVTVGLAAASYHLVEKPIRQGRLSGFLTGPRVAVALPVTLAILIAANTALVVPRAGAGTGHDGTTRTIVLVGDSVPQRLGLELSSAAAKHGYTVVRATRGGCPATGVTVVDAHGRPTGEGGSCSRLVPTLQDTAVTRFHPALVIWWSRYELADRLAANGSVLTTGSPAYWRAQERSFANRVAALTRLGARVVTVQIETTGGGVATRCTFDRCGPFVRRLVDRADLRTHWNGFLARSHRPGVRSISIERLVCRDRSSPCDDRLPDGSWARPDGSHYGPEAASTIARAIITRSLAAAGLPSPFLPVARRPSGTSAWAMEPPSVPASKLRAALAPEPGSDR